ncbi:MAG: hypothetical protein AB1647_15145 [Pseudomonadota bacterium]|jgi:hypothetical protein
MTRLRPTCAEASARKQGSGGQARLVVRPSGYGGLARLAITTIEVTGLVAFWAGSAFIGGFVL